MVEKIKELVLNKLSKELGKHVGRDVELSPQGSSFMFDGVAMDDDKVTAIKIKHFKDAQSIPNRFREEFLEILREEEMLPDSVSSRFSLIIAVATNAPSTDHEKISNRLYSLIGITPFPIKVRIFRTQELEKEFNLAR